MPTMERYGLAFAVPLLATVVLTPFAGRLADLWGPIRVMRASLFLSGAVLLAFPFARGGAALLVALKVTPLIETATHPAGAGSPRAMRRSLALLAPALSLACGLAPALVLRMLRV